MYSTSVMKPDRKSPLAKSPTRLRPPRPILRSSNSSSVQTPPGSLTKLHKPIRSVDIEKSDLRPEYHTISCELKALTKMVWDELGKADAGDGAVANSCSGNSSPLFERGRFYEAYSARRNERLRRKKGLSADEGKPVRNLGVTVESAKKSTSRKLENLRKSISAAYSVERNETPRYMLRSMTKENKKPPLPTNADKSTLRGEKKTARRVRKI